MPFTSSLRSAPLGVLILAALFTMIGIGSLAGGGYLLVDEGSLSPWAGGIALVVGPAVLYLSYNLVQLARWTWLALMIVLALLFVSSALRIAGAVEFPTAALGEVAVEVIVAFYLTRPSIRARFGWYDRA